MNSEEILRKVICEEFARELAQIPSDEELKKIIEVSPAFHPRMMLLIRRHWRAALIQRMARNVAGFIIAIISGVLIMCAINEDVRAVCIRWIASLDEENNMMEYKFPSPDIEKIGENRDTKGFALGYVPEGYDLDKGTSISSPNYGNVVYWKESEKIIFGYIRNSNAVHMINVEHSELFHIRLTDGTSCDYYESRNEDDGSRLVWKEGDYICFLTAFGIEKEEFIRMADSVSEKK